MRLCRWVHSYSNARLNTDVIIGPYTDEEVNNNESTNVWKGPKVKGKICTEVFLSINDLTPEQSYTEFPLKHFEIQ